MNRISGLIRRDMGASSLSLLFAMGAYTRKSASVSQEKEELSPDT